MLTQKAREISCVNNLKQNILSINTYCMDNEDTMILYDGQHGGWTWVSILAKSGYYGLNGNRLNEPEVDARANCPSQAKKSSACYTNPMGTGSTYGMYGAFIPYRKSFSGYVFQDLKGNRITDHSYYTVLALKELRGSSSNSIVLSDTWQKAEQTGFAMLYPVQTANAAFSTVQHRGKGVTGFAAGNVSAITQGQYLDCIRDMMDEGKSLEGKTVKVFNTPNAASEHTVTK